MGVTRRDILRLLAAAGVLAPARPARAISRLLEADAASLYDKEPFGNVTLLVTADLHGHLQPHYLMEPPNLLAPQNLRNTPGYVAGEEFLRHWGIRPGSLEAYFMTCVDFPELARRFGVMGGGAYLTALIRRQRELLGRDRVLTLDAGDTWVTSGLGLLTEGNAVVDWMNLTGYDHMVAHWEFTLGRERFDERLQQLAARFLSFNVVDDLFGDPLYEPYAIHHVSGYAIGVVGASFPYVRVAHPVRFTEGLSFGVREHELQRYVDELRDEGVDVVVLLSHNGLPLDTGLARRVQGIDLIVTSHTHDITPSVVRVGPTRIVSVGSGGKFLGRIDLQVRKGALEDVRLHLFPVLPAVLEPDPEAERLIEEARAPFREKLDEVLGTTETLLFKRDTVFSTFDRLAGMAMEAAYPEVEIAFSPGFRWGTTVLPGQPVTFEKVLDFTALTYPEVYVFRMEGARLKQVLEDIAENVFQPDPFYQQGGDMSRLHGASYDLMLSARQGDRIRNLTVRGRPLVPEREYVVAAYGGNLQNAGTLLEKYEPRPIYDIVAEYVRQVKVVKVESAPNVRVLDQAYNPSPS